MLPTLAERRACYVTRGKPSAFKDKGKCSWVFSRHPPLLGARDLTLDIGQNKPDLASSNVEGVECSGHGTCDVTVGECTCEGAYAPMGMPAGTSGVCTGDITYAQIPTRMERARVSTLLHTHVHARTYVSVAPMTSDSSTMGGLVMMFLLLAVLFPCLCFPCKCTDTDATTHTHTHTHTQALTNLRSHTKGYTVPRNV